MSIRQEWTPEKNSAKNYSASRSNENARQNNSKTWIFHKSKPSRPESNFSKKARGIASLYRRNWTAADRRYIATPPRPPEIVIKKQTISYSDAKNKPCKRIYENEEPTKLFSSYQSGNKPKEKLNLAPEIEGTNICDKQSSFQKTLITSSNEKFTHPLQVSFGNSNVVDTTENAWDVCKENKTDVYKHSVNKKSDASTKIMLINNAVLEARKNFIKLNTEIKRLNAVIPNPQTEGEFLLKENNEELKSFKQLKRNYRITINNQVANRNISLTDKYAYDGQSPCQINTWKKRRKSSNQEKITQISTNRKITASHRTTSEVGDLIPPPYHSSP